MSQRGGLFLDSVLASSYQKLPHAWPAAQKPDHRHPRLLRPRRKRPRRCSAAQPRDELPPPHWITSSAVANSVSGMVRPSALAVLLLITSSNLVDCTTGRSAGFSPLRMRST
jgi:hypothetical protein